MSYIRFDNLKGDVFGGINAGIVALPAALAFGALAGLEPIHGLYGAIFLGLFAAVFGGTQTLISNPTGPMAVVTGEIVIGLVTKLKLGSDISLTERIENIWPYLMVIILLAGLFQILFGAIKLGKYVHYIPTPVISGFMSGIGVIIIVSQIKPVLGVSSDVRGTLNILAALPSFISQIDYVSVSIAISTMLIIYLFPKITKAVPSQLVAVVAVTGVTAAIGLEGKYLIAKITGGMPELQISALTGFTTNLDSTMVSFLITSGIYLALIGTIDALLTAVVADNLTKTKHNSDKELVGQGLGNIISGMFGGMMGAGTTPSTVLNIKSGGKTRLSGIIHAILLIAILLVGANIASYIPTAALAGILIPVGISILDFEVFRKIRVIPKQDNMVMITVLLLTSCWDLMYAVALGLISAALIFMKNMADVVEGQSQNTKVDRLVNQLITNFENSDEFREKVLVRNMRGPMFFGFASRFQDSMEKMLPGKKVVLLNLSGVPYMDQSGLYTFQESVQRLADKNINICVSEANDRILELFRGIEIIPELIDENHVFSSVEECIMWLNEPGHIDNQYGSDEDLYIPSAYTPNGDGINDEWQIRNIDKYPNAKVIIRTREGKEIFHVIGYQTMWEGIYNGKMLPSDTYHYKIDLHNDGSDVRKGNVTIFR